MSGEGWAAAAQAAMELTNTGLGLYQSSKSYRRAVQMYKHRYQWAVEDMRKAGLNPVLAATNGASVGGSSIGATIPAKMNSSAISSAYQAMSAADANNASAALNEASAKEVQENARVERMNKISQMHANGAQERKFYAEEANAWQMQDLIREQVQSARNLNKVQQQFVDYAERNPTLRNLGFALQTILPAVNGASNLMKMAK